MNLSSPYLVNLLVVLILTLVGIFTAGCGLFSNFIANRIYKIQSPFFSIVFESLIFALGSLTSAFLIVMVINMTTTGYAYASPAIFMILLTPVLQGLINLGILIWNREKKKLVSKKFKLILLATGAPISILVVVLLGIK